MSNLTMFKYNMTAMERDNTMELLKNLENESVKCRYCGNPAKYYYFGKGNPVPLCQTCKDAMVESQRFPEEGDGIDGGKNGKDDSLIASEGWSMAVDHATYLEHAYVTFKISPAIVDTLRLYYEHRKAQSEIPWDKAADLGVIFAAAKAEGWSSTAMAGTFWFQKFLPGTKIDVIVKMSEGNYQAGGETSVRRNSDGTSEGLRYLADTIKDIEKRQGHAPIAIIHREN